MSGGDSYSIEIICIWVHVVDILSKLQKSYQIEVVLTGCMA
jgi:hypothetical protein